MYRPEPFTTAGCLLSSPSRLDEEALKDGSWLRPGAQRACVHACGDRKAFVGSRTVGFLLTRYNVTPGVR